jgi:hypothetical protein
MHWLNRLVPSLLTIVFIALTRGLLAADIGSMEVRPGRHASPAAVLSSMESVQPQACDDLHALSVQAAALTGSLALVEAAERPARAREAARQIRTFVARVDDAEKDVPLGGILNDLSRALEAYAAGSPAALSEVRAASARNAQLRHALRYCSGGLADEN